MTVTSALLIAMRWSTLALALVSLLSSAAVSCVAIQNIFHVVFALTYQPVNIFLSLRIFAMWERNWSLFAMILVLGLTPLITNSFSAADFTYGPFRGPVSLCVNFLKPTITDFERKYTIADYVTQGVLLLQDILVLCLTWMKTYRKWTDARRVKVSVSVLECLLRDGTLYFVIMCAINITQMVIFDAESGEILGLYLNALPLVLMSRFVINLRQTCEIGDSSVPSTVIFRRETNILGNVGESLEYAEPRPDTSDPRDGQAGPESVQ